MEFIAALREAMPREDVFIWEGAGDNPYVDILSYADVLIAPGDSHNMTSEALAAGVGVYVWRPRGLSGKLDWFVSELVKRGMAREFANDASPFGATAYDATPEIVDNIRQRIGVDGSTPI